VKKEKSALRAGTGGGRGTAAMLPKTLQGLLAADAEIRRAGEGMMPGMKIFCQVALPRAERVLDKAVYLPGEQTQAA
jgi:hypothetical protein